jgi:hypothetical protein
MSGKGANVMVLRAVFGLLCLAWTVSLAGSWHQAWAASFWDTVLRITGISATPSQQKGPDDELEAGDIWVADLAHNTRLRVTRDGGYRSPVFMPGDDSLLALQGGQLVRLPVAGGSSQTLATIKGVVKLVGFHRKDADKVLLLMEDSGRFTVGLLSLTSGQVTPVPYDERSDKDLLMLSHIKGWERTYGVTKVYVKSESQLGLASPVEWSDVYIQQGSKDPVNLSKCDGVSCNQPSLSHSGQQVAFVKLGR